MASESGPVKPRTAERNILDAGANPDGRTLNTSTIQGVIDDVHRAGGGTVYAPPGTFLIGGLELKSGVTLFVEAGCTLLGSPSIEDYTFHPGPPKDADANGCHVLFAQDADDVSICGTGTIDGQGPAYWEPTVGRAPTRSEDAWMEGATGWYWVRNNNRRPSPMIEFAGCRNVHVRDLTLKNSSGWTLRPIACDTVVIDAIRIRNPVFGPNTDGLDITACRNVFVSNCDIITGDDAICLKSENAYSKVSLTSNINVTRCKLSGCCNGFKIGTGTSGQFENIVVSDLTVFNPNVPFNQRIIAGIALEMVDGGSVDGVRISGVTMQRARAPIFIRLGNRNPGPSGSAGSLRNISISGVQATGTILTSSISGLKGDPVGDITLSDIHVESEEGGREDWIRGEVPEQEHSYPEAKMFGRLPAYGLYCRHARRIHINGFDLSGAPSEGRPPFFFDDVEDSDIAGLRASPSHGAKHLVEMSHCHNVKVQESAA